jgi:hypothetical protein
MFAKKLGKKRYSIKELNSEYVKSYPEDLCLIKKMWKGLKEEELLLLARKRNLL